MIEISKIVLNDMLIAMGLLLCQTKLDIIIGRPTTVLLFILLLGPVSSPFPLFPLKNRSTCSYPLIKAFLSEFQIRSKPSHRKIAIQIIGDNDKVHNN